MSVKEDTRSDSPPPGIPDITPMIEEKKASVEKALRGPMLPAPQPMKVGKPARTSAQEAAAQEPAEKPLSGIFGGADPVLVQARKSAEEIQTALGNLVRNARTVVAVTRERLPHLADPTAAAHVAIAADFNPDAAEAFITELEALLAKHLA
ncbi:hypothetical protein HNR46_001338 [Haloferula luteola]|uniref:Uncharacterized protein n=1 Tax=Haloferula luteola TaxID=595692 RepID=A0A840V649_9BACT|nr:hypothetical protein [Haloferula luteola]MBB5351104.1 hypothetical protein [Haloferula luteola]